LHTEVELFVQTVKALLAVLACQTHQRTSLPDLLVKFENSPCAGVVAMVGSLLGETSRGTDMLMGLVGGGTVGVVDREEYSVTGALWFAAVSLYDRYGNKRRGGEKWG
jgi:hypothetical protein